MRSGPRAHCKFISRASHLWVTADAGLWFPLPTWYKTTTAICHCHPPWSRHCLGCLASRSGSLSEGVAGAGVDSSHSPGAGGGKTHVAPRRLSLDSRGGQRAKGAGGRHPGISPITFNLVSKVSRHHFRFPEGNHSPVFKGRVLKALQTC